MSVNSYNPGVKSRISRGRYEWSGELGRYVRKSYGDMEEFITIVMKHEPSSSDRNGSLMYWTSTSETEDRQYNGTFRKIYKHSSRRYIFIKKPSKDTVIKEVFFHSTAETRELEKTGLLLRYYFKYSNGEEEIRSPFGWHKAGLDIKVVHHLVVPDIKIYNEQCPICLENIDDECDVLKCGHSYHTQCISWSDSEYCINEKGFVKCSLCKRISN